MKLPTAMADLTLVRCVAALADLVSVDPMRFSIDGVIVHGTKLDVTLAATNGVALGIVSLITDSFDGLSGKVPGVVARAMAREWKTPQHEGWIDDDEDGWWHSADTKQWSSILRQQVLPVEKEKAIALEKLYGVMPKPGPRETTSSWFGSAAVQPIFSALDILGSASFAWSGSADPVGPCRIDTAPDFGRDDWWLCRRTASFCVMPRKQP